MTWRLAHAHGTFLAVVNLAFALTLYVLGESAQGAWRRIAIWVSSRSNNCPACRILSRRHCDIRRRSGLRNLPLSPGRTSPGNRRFGNSSSLASVGSARSSQRRDDLRGGVFCCHRSDGHVCRVSPTVVLLDSFENRGDFATPPGYRATCERLRWQTIRNC